MEDKLNIFRFVTLLYDPLNILPQNLGGVPIQVFRLTKSLSNYNVAQDIFTKSKVYIKIKNSTVINPPFPNLLSLFFFSIYILFKYKTKYNCIHIHADGGFVPLLFGKFVYRFFDFPIVYTFHCCRNTTYQTKGLEKLFKCLMNHLEKDCIQHASHCVFLSKNTINILKDKGIIINDNKITVISDSVATDKNICNTDINQKEIIYIGRISPEKGWDVFIECAEKLKNYDYQFVIYGTGPQKKKMLRQIKKKRLSNIHYCGTVSNEKIFSIMANANIIMVPSYYEELGSVVLEAGIMQKNVIASDVGGLSELLSNNKGYLVHAGCVNDFCNAIKYIIENNLSYGRNLYDYVVQEYDILNSVEKYYKIYKNLE